MAQVHTAAFERPWDAAAFAALIAQPGVTALGDADGFILIRTVADEAEILTLAVIPAVRRRGQGRALVQAAAIQARAAGAQRLFLEVAEDNAAATALYRQAGFAEVGRRARYYPRTGGEDAAALLLALNLVD